MQAFANANPESQVGRIASYYEAALATQEAEATALEAQAELEAIQAAYDGRTSAEIEADIEAVSEQIDGLDEDDEALAELEAELEALEAELAVAREFDEQVAQLQATIDAYEEAQIAEEEALQEASGGRTLSEAAISELRDILGL